MSLSSDNPLVTMPVAPANNSGFGGFGGDGAWWIIILFLFVFCGWGGNWGGGYNSGNGAGVVDGYVLTSDFANIERKLDGVNNGLCDGFYAQNTTMLQGFAGINQNISNGFMSAELSRCNQQAALMQQLNNMAMQQANCCCETREAIQNVNYNLATQGCEVKQAIGTGTRDIIDNQNANARAILDALTAQRIEAKDAKIAEQGQQIFAAQLAASQAAQNNYLLNQLRPTPIPAYQSCNPWAGGSYNGCCGSGCGC